MNDWMVRVRATRVHVAVGLMSGTSADGIDAALVQLADAPGGRVDQRLLAFLTVPYPAAIQRQVLEAAAGSVRDLVDLDYALGEMFGDAALAVMRAGGLEPDQVDFVGSHGQTVFHRAPRGQRVGATLQIGCPAVIRERTGRLVVADFRVRDIALGGHGAPLVPLVDRLLFARPHECRVLLNLGGIANLTALARDGAEITAFDVGPGNALMDGLMRCATQGREACDRDGQRALMGCVLEPLLAELLAHPFLAEPPPRSADRAEFGEALAARILARHASVPLADLLATAASFTATSIARAIGALAPPFTGVARVIASGGGVHNKALMAGLATALAPIPLETSDQHGLPADAKEAVAFAILARETLLGRVGNVPSVTGARAAAILGSITP